MYEKTGTCYKNKNHLLFGKWFCTVIAEGFEPSTASLEGRCSIQLSYATDKLKFHTLIMGANIGDKLSMPQLLSDVFIGINLDIS